MGKIYENDRVTSSKAENEKEKVKRWQREGHTISIEDVDSDDTINLEPFNPIDGSESFCEEVPTSSTNSLPKQSAMKKRGIKRKAPIADVINEGVQDIKVAMMEIADAMRSSSNPKPVASIEEQVVKILKEDGVDGDLLCDALDFLVADAVLARSFIALDGHLRLNWLSRKCRRGSCVFVSISPFLWS